MTLQSVGFSPTVIIDEQHWRVPVAIYSEFSEFIISL